MQAKYGGLTPRARTETAGVSGCWREQLGKKRAVWALSKAKDSPKAQLEIPSNIGGYCSLRLLAALGKRSDFKTFSGICARKLGCMTFRAKFRIASISHSPNTFYDNISKPFMNISYSSLSSFEVENRKATLLATEPRALTCSWSQRKTMTGFVWGRRKGKENQPPNVNCLFLQSQKHGTSPAVVLLGLGRNTTITTSK